MIPCFRTTPVRPAFAQPPRSTTSECSHHGYAVRQLGVPFMGQGDQGALLQSKTCTTTLDGRADLQSEQRRLAALARTRYTQLAISPAMGATGTLALLRRIFSIKKPATVAVTLCDYT